MKTNRKQKLITVMLTICLLGQCVWLSACGKQQPIEEHEVNINDKIDLKVDAYRTDLADSSGAMNSNTGIRNYLRSWASSKGVSHQEDANGNVIMSVKSSEAYQEAPPVVVICPYDSNQIQQYMSPMALALYLVKNNEDTGKLTVIFTRENRHNFAGLKKLSAKYFTDDTQVICLNGSGKSQFSLNTGAQIGFHFSKGIRRVKPEYQKAYRIRLTGLSGGQVNSDVDSIINPAVRLRALLTSLTKSSIGYELADFQSGESGFLIPSSASMTIVIDKDKEQKFIDKMTKQTEEFNEDKNNSHPGAEYTFQKVKRPVQVIREADTTRFVSFVYTLLNGEYVREEDGSLKAVNGITSIRTETNRIRINSVAYSLTMTSISEISNDEKALSNLSDMHFHFGETIPAWNGNADSDLAQQIRTAYRQFKGKSLTYSDSITSTSANFIRSKNEKAQVISITVNDNVLKTCTGTLIQYLKNTPHTDLTAEQATS